MQQGRCGSPGNAETDCAQRLGAEKSMTTIQSTGVPAVIESKPTVVPVHLRPLKRDATGNIKITWADLDWTNVIGIGSMHLACLAAPFFFAWSSLGIAALFWWICGGLGVCLCYHRLLTHRSFKTYKPVEYILAFIGTSNWQGGPVQWVGTHRLHHKHSDEEDDPHSPRHGFNWAHVLWCLCKEHGSMRAVDAAKDLQRDKVHAFINKHHYLSQIVIAAVLGAAGWMVGGWWLATSWVIWGVAVRIVFTYHATWFVNSAAHTWGYQTHKTGDDSRNNWWVSILSFGEGWHNNHHAHQRAAAHGRAWWEFDPTYLTIKGMQLVGLAWDVVPAGPSHDHD
jgi:stearoyl-CoA desaturase (delta-9 desaturase)